MNIEFRNAKNTIRTALRDATREKVEEILEAARERYVPWADVEDCPACHLYGEPTLEPERFWRLGRPASYSHTNPAWGEVSDAYRDLAPKHYKKYFAEITRQEILATMCRAELKRRGRETVRQLVESAEPTRRERPSLGHIDIGSWAHAGSCFAWVTPSLVVNEEMK